MRPTRAPKASTVKTVPSMILYEATAQLVNDVHQSGPLTYSVGGAHRDSLVSAQLPRVPTSGTPLSDCPIIKPPDRNIANHANTRRRYR